MKLLINKDYIGLDTLYRTHIETFISKNIQSLEELYSPENKEKFLSYLLPLFQKGKLKVKVSSIVEIPVTEEDILRKEELRGHSAMYDFIDTKEYSHPSQAEEAIADIRERWLQTPEKDRDMFEQFWIIFTLPENEWMM